MKILFVCLGNICRSPTAEAVMSQIIAQDPSLGHVEIDSAGTGDWHVGQLPDERMREHCQRRGYPMTMRARQIQPEDLERFDLVLAMDESNQRNILGLNPAAGSHNVELMTNYCSNFKLREVPDPYFGGPEGFEQVIDILEDACAGLADHIKACKSRP